MRYVLSGCHWKTKQRTQETSLLDVWSPWMEETLPQLGTPVIRQQDGRLFVLLSPEDVIAHIETYCPPEEDAPYFEVHPPSERSLPRRLRKPRLSRRNPWRDLPVLSLAILAEVLHDEHVLQKALQTLPEVQQTFRTQLEVLVSQNPALVAVASQASQNHLIELVHRLEQGLSETFLQVCLEQVFAQRSLPPPQRTLALAS